MNINRVSIIFMVLLLSRDYFHIRMQFRLDFTTATALVYCEVKSEYLNVIQVNRRV